MEGKKCLVRFRCIADEFRKNSYLHQSGILIFYKNRVLQQAFSMRANYLIRL